MTAQGLREKITANSRAWHLADEEEKKALHRENVELYAQLDGLTGSVSTYDGKTGAWKTAKPGTEDYVAAELPQAAQLSGEAARLQKGATEKALSGLARAKNKAGKAIDAQEAAIGETYQSARNRAAAQNEIERKNLGEQAAQSGLNTGAAGQLALAQNMAAQGELSAIDAQESEARRETAQARRELESEYAFAVAEAQAEGDYALAQALYDEAVRYDEAQRARARDQEDIAQKTYQLARENRLREAEDEERSYQRGQDAAKWAYQVEQQKREDAQRQEDALLKQAQSRASFGDFQGYAKLGYSQEEIDRMGRLWRYYQFIK